MKFRAIWPILGHVRDMRSLCDEAERDLPVLLGRAHARPVGAGRYSVARSEDVPGSGRVTPWVLVYECPAVRMPARAYHRRAA